MGRVKEETVKPTKEASSIQFGSQPEVQVNMVYPCSMDFFKNGQTSKNQGDTWLNLCKSDISEDTRSDDELTIICNDCDLADMAQTEMDKNLVCEIEQNQESLKVSSKESACFVPDSIATTNFAKAEMYKLDVVPLSELLQAATYPTNEMELGELAELKSMLKQTVDYESDTPKDDAAWM
ncbi:hypothetical protein RHGRI_023650 [Rhododendron griersonianum]|uniref:Uncharacterized protein n=1 Tax=Rhododendron griersonianum TaxID=479676 RepID=A0AAV6J614_9ERIC|nr:hypothetical protein RHGRI_023650 [Rhododendron griersonianum]